MAEIMAEIVAAIMAEIVAEIVVEIMPEWWRSCRRSWWRSSWWNDDDMPMDLRIISKRDPEDLVVRLMLPAHNPLLTSRRADAQHLAGPRNLRVKVELLDVCGLRLSWRATNWRGGCRWCMLTTRDPKDFDWLLGGDVQLELKRHIGGAQIKVLVLLVPNRAFEEKGTREKITSDEAATSLGVEIEMGTLGEGAK